MYAKIVNEETKLCEVGPGTNTKFYKSIGMTEMEVEQAYNGSWYVKGYAPTESTEEKKQKIKAIRDEMLNSISWRVDRAREQKELGIICVDNYNELLEYKQYLRDYPDKTENWWEQEPKTFEDWRENEES